MNVNHRKSEMAAFYRHVCLWPNCGRKCNSLKELIDHIEVIHIERDPVVLEKQEATQPAAIALSYVSCFFADRPVKKIQKIDSGIHGLLHINQDKKSAALKRKLPTNDPESLYDDDLCSISDAESEDSCNSWSTNASSCQESEEHREGKRRFICPVQGCGKRYKNINGIKYHTKNGHNRKLENKVRTPKPVPRPAGEESRKGFRCQCGKTYKSQSGLRHHQNTQHGKKPSTVGKDTLGLQEQLRKQPLLAQVKIPHLEMYTAATKTINRT